MKTGTKEHLHCSVGGAHGSLRSIACHAILLAVMVFLSPFSTLPVLGQSAEEAVRKRVKDDWPKAYADFGKESEARPLNFIFVLDVSDEYFGDEIKRTVRNFLKPVKDGDYFNVILLGDEKRTTNISACAVINKSKKDEISSEINTKVFGTIGSNSTKATDLVLDALTCSGAKKATPIIIMISDFVHYGNTWSVPSDREWKPLIVKYENIRRNIENPYVYCLELINIDKKPQYLSKLKNLFKDLSIVTCQKPTLLEDKFIDIRARIAKKHLYNFIVAKAKTQNENLTLVNTQKGIQLKNPESLIYDRIELDNESKSRISNVLNSKSLIAILPPSKVNVYVSGRLIATKYKTEIGDLRDLPVSNQKVALVPNAPIIPWYIGLPLVALLVFWVGSIIFHLITFRSKRNWRVSASFYKFIRDEWDWNKDIDTIRIDEKDTFTISEKSSDCSIQDINATFEVTCKRNLLCIPFIHKLKRGYHLTPLRFSGTLEVYVNSVKKDSNKDTIWIGSSGNSFKGCELVLISSDIVDQTKKKIKIS